MQNRNPYEPPRTFDLDFAPPDKTLRVVLVGIWLPIVLACFLYVLIFVAAKLYPPTTPPLVALLVILVAVVGGGAHLVSVLGIVGIVLVLRKRIQSSRVVLLSSIAGLLAGVPILARMYHVAGLE
jgi:hypothetical protein